MSDEHVKRSYVVEDSWKCGACAHVNRGRDLKCANCGAPKGKKDADVSDAEAAEVTDEKLLAQANAGANWVCTFCGSQDRSGDGRCRNCGASQDDARAPAPTGAPPPAMAAATPAPKKKRHVGLIVGLVVLGSCAIGVGTCVMPHERAAKVVATHWTYTADLEHRELLHDSGFNKPADAFNARCETRQHGTHDCEPYSCNSHSESTDCNPHDCNCHKVTKSKGNGYSQVEEVCSTCYDKCSKQVTDTCYRQCPTYDQWCAYDHYAWRKLSTEKTEGDDANVRWPADAATSADTRVQRHEDYTVTFDADGKRLAYQPKTLDEFKKFAQGAAWKVKTNAAGGVWPEAPLR